MSQNMEQNSAFRTREAQEDSLTYHLGGLQAARNFRLLARAMIQEAEARGAEEQRRKDAAGQLQTLNENGEWTSVSRDEYLHAPNEGRRIVPANVPARAKAAEGHEPIYQVKLKGGLCSWQDVSLEQYQERSQLSWLRRTLYTRPANVAALEADIAKLRAENDHQRTQILELRNDDRRIRLAAERVCSVRDQSEIFQSRIALRAALTREGGV